MNKKDRKPYVSPSIEVVKVSVQASLLASSVEVTGSIENGNLKDFDENWE